MGGANVLVKSSLVLLAATILVRDSAAVRPHALAGAIAAEKARQARYLNSWALEVRDGSDAAADALAQKHGLVNRGRVRCTNRITRMRLGFCEFYLQIGNLRNHYLFVDGQEVREVTKELRSLMEAKTAALKAEEEVKRLLVCCFSHTLRLHSKRA